jgi:hypothetical protein
MRTDHEILESWDERFDVGGGYFNPVSALDKLGEVITVASSLSDVQGINLLNEGEPTYIVARLFRELSGRLRDDQYLFAVYDRGSFRLAPYLYDEERLLNFEEQVADGALRRIAFMAVEHAVADEGLKRDFPIPDEEESSHGAQGEVAG